MTPSGFILFVGCFSCVMPTEGVSRQTIYLYHRPEEDVTLPCHGASICYSVDWSYRGGYLDSRQEVEKGKVEQSSARAHRLRVTPDCSLVIRNVSKEDAGLYTCVIHSISGRMHTTQTTKTVHLNILTVVPLVSDSDRGGNITLECSLWGHAHRRSCPQNNPRWVGETCSAPTNDNYNFKPYYLRNCICVLRVNPSRRSSRYTCEFVDGNNDTLISAEYTPAFASEKADDQTRDSPADCAGWTPLSSFMLTLRIIEVCMIAVVTFLLIRNTVGRTS